MNWYEAEVQALEKASVRDPSAVPPAVFYGSSSIRLWTTLAADFPDLPVVNLGFGGSTLEACSWFFYRLVVPQRPASLVVYAGDNDLGDGRSPEQVFAAYCALAAQVRQHLGAIPFTYLAIKPSPARFALTDTIRATNERIRTEHLAHPNNIFIDLFTPMRNRTGTPRPELYAADGLHLSAEGYRLWRDMISLYRHTAF